MNPKQDTYEPIAEKSNDASSPNEEENILLKLEETSSSSNNEVKNAENKFKKIHRNFAKFFLKTSKKEFKSEACTLNKSNKICFSSCMCGAISAINSPVESEETKKCPVFTCLDKTIDKNQSEVKHIETLLTNSISSSELHTSTEKTSRALIPQQQELEICVPKAVPSSLVNHSAEPNLYADSKLRSKPVSNIKDYSGSCAARIDQRNGNEYRECDKPLYSTKGNIIAGHRSMSDVNLHNYNDCAASISNKKTGENLPSISFLSSDGCLRRYTINTLTLIEDTPVLDDEIIYSYLNEYKYSPEKVRGFVSLPSENSSVCSDNVFYNDDAIDLTKYQRYDKDLELKFENEETPKRDSGYDPRYDILKMMDESFVAAPPPSLCSKHSPANVDVCSSEIENDRFDTSLSEKSLQISPKYTRETPFDAINEFYRTGRLCSENCIADSITDNEFVNCFKSISLPRNTKQLANALSVFPNKVNSNETSIVNKNELTILDIKNVRYEQPSKITVRPSQSPNNYSDTSIDSKKMYIQETKKRNSDIL